jgi:hypothetical protein
MGADQQGWGCGIGGWVELAEEIAGGVDAAGHAGGGHPTGQCLVQPRHGGGAKRAMDDAGNVGEFGQPVTTIHYSLSDRAEVV